MNKPPGPGLLAFARECYDLISPNNLRPNIPPSRASIGNGGWRRKGFGKSMVFEEEKMQKVLALSLLCAAAFAAGACNNDSGSSPAPSTTATPLASITPAGTPIASARTVTDTRTVENKDGSTTVVTTYSDGSKSEVRTFSTGRVARVTRDTSGTGVRTARVTYRDDSTDVEIKDESWIDKAMDATGDALATAAHKTKEGAKAAADKAEDVGDATKKGAKKAANETADKAEDVGDAVKKGAKKTGRAIKDAVTPDKKKNNN
jgi:hypothetical protein